MLINSPDGLHRSPNTGDGTEFGDTPYQMAQRINALNQKNTALNTVGAGTVLAAGIVGGFVSRGGAQSGTAFTDTTDTAANIIAAMTPAAAGVNTVLLNSLTFGYLNNTNAIATVTGGTGVTVSGVTSVPPGEWVEYLVAYSAAATVTMVGMAMGPINALPPSKFSQNTTAGATTAAVGDLTGANSVNLQITAVGAANYTTRTAAQMIADMPNVLIGFSWEITIQNTSGGTVTVVGGTGVTVTGTATIANATARKFVATYTAAGAITLQSIGTMTA
jgi:hypothetical protein